MLHEWMNDYFEYELGFIYDKYSGTKHEGLEHLHTLHEKWTNFKINVTNVEPKSSTEKKRWISLLILGFLIDVGCLWQTGNDSEWLSYKIAWSGECEYFIGCFQHFDSEINY